MLAAARRPGVARLSAHFGADSSMGPRCPDPGERSVLDARWPGIEFPHLKHGRGVTNVTGLLPEIPLDKQKPGPSTGFHAWSLVAGDGFEPPTFGL